METWQINSAAYKLMFHFDCYWVFTDHVVVS